MFSTSVRPGTKGCIFAHSPVKVKLREYVRLLERDDDEVMLAGEPSSFSSQHPVWGRALEHVHADDLEYIAAAAGLRALILRERHGGGRAAREAVRAALGARAHGALATLLRHFLVFPYIGPEFDDPDGPASCGFPTHFCDLFARPVAPTPCLRNRAYNAMLEAAHLGLLSDLVAGGGDDEADSRAAFVKAVARSGELRCILFRVKLLIKTDGVHQRLRAHAALIADSMASLGPTNYASTTEMTAVTEWADSFSACDACGTFKPTSEGCAQCRCSGSYPSGAQSPSNPDTRAQSSPRLTLRC